METSFAFWGPTTAFLASVTWAVGVLGYSKLAHAFPAYIINLHRILIGLPAAMILLTFMGQWTTSIAALDGKLVAWAVVVVLSSYAFGDALFFMATKKLGGPAALAIASMYPLWSALWGAAFEAQPLGPRQIAGVLMVIVGVVAVILSGAKQENLAPRVPRLQELEIKPARKRFYKPQLGARSVGIALAVAASLAWAMNTIAVSKLGQNLNAMFVNVVRLGIALFLCPLIGVAMNGRTSLRLIPRSVLVPYLPVFAVECVLGPFFYVYGLSHSPLAVAAALSALAPAISVPVAVLCGRESFSMLKSAGILTVVLGVWALL